MGCEKLSGGAVLQNAASSFTISEISPMTYRKDYVTRDRRNNALLPLQVSLCG